MNYSPDGQSENADFEWFKEDAGEPSPRPRFSNFLVKRWPTGVLLGLLKISNIDCHRVPLPLQHMAVTLQQFGPSYTALEALIFAIRGEFHERLVSKSLFD